MARRNNIRKKERERGASRAHLDPPPPPTTIKHMSSSSPPSSPRRVLFVRPIPPLPSSFFCRHDLCSWPPGMMIAPTRKHQCSIATARRRHRCLWNLQPSVKKPYNIESGASVPALSLPCGQFHKSRKGGEKREEVLLTFLPFLKRAKGMRGGEGEKEKKVGGGGERGRRASSVEEEEEKDE